MATCGSSIILSNALCIGTLNESFTLSLNEFDKKLEFIIYSYYFAN